jgi:uncharacterized protein YdaT
MRGLPWDEIPAGFGTYNPKAVKSAKRLGIKPPAGRSQARAIASATKGEKASESRVAVATKTKAPAWKPTMSTAEADAFTKESAFKATTTHTTPSRNVESLKTEGFNLSNRKGGRVWGDGVYVATDRGTTQFYEGFFGEKVSTLKVRVDVRNPYVVKYTKADAELVPYGSGPTPVRSRVGVERIAKELGVDERIHDAMNRHQDAFLDWRADLREVRKAADPMNPASERAAAAGEEWRKTHPRPTGIDTLTFEGAVTDELKRRGFDGIVVEIDPEALRLWGRVGGSQVVVFDPKRVVIVED